MQRLKAPFIYFLLVYVAGFAFGTLREFFVTPYVGLTAALLIELPIMALASFLAAQFVIDRLNRTTPPGDRLFIGCTAFLMLLAAEEAMSWILRGISIFTLWAEFSLLATIANLVGLALFMLMPLWIRRSGIARQPG